MKKLIQIELRKIFVSLMSAEQTSSSVLYDIEDTELIIRIKQLILQFIAEHIKSDMFESRYIDYIGRRKMQ